jgi:hypothetical protein
MPAVYSPTVMAMMTIPHGPPPNIPVPFLAVPTPGSKPIPVDPDPADTIGSRRG